MTLLSKHNYHRLHCRTGRKRKNITQWDGIDSTDTRSQQGRHPTRKMSNTSCYCYSTHQLFPYTHPNQIQCIAQEKRTVMEIADWLWKKSNASTKMLLLSLMNLILAFRMSTSWSSIRSSWTSLRLLGARDLACSISLATNSGYTSMWSRWYFTASYQQFHLLSERKNRDKSCEKQNVHISVSNSGS